MLSIEYPTSGLRIKNTEKGEVIFDEIRRKWVAITPEEWVRQNFLQYLLKTLQYPRSLIAVEKKFRLAELTKRCDIVVYRKEEPWMIVECKEMKVPIDQKVLEQVIRYNMAIPSKYLVITNGIHTYSFERKNEGLEERNHMPPFANERS